MKPVRYSSLALVLLLWPSWGISQPGVVTDQSQQPLVTDAPVIAVEDQEQLGLVMVQRSGMGPHCSGVMLRNDWIATAAHCLDRVSDRMQPATVRVRANWRFDAGTDRLGNQVRTAAAIYTFWTNRTSSQIPETTYDVALVRLAAPIRISGQATGYHRPIDGGGLFELLNVGVRVYGRGLSQWASRDANNMPVQSSGDGLYRGATFSQVTLNGHPRQPGQFANLIQYPSTAANSVLGGDSGGPTFRSAANASAPLIGVHALCSETDCLLPGRCPDSDGNWWRWVTGVEWCADAPLSTVRNAIEDLMAQTWDPTAVSQQIEVPHSEGDIERDLRLGQVDGLRWAYVARAVQKMCVNRGFAAGIGCKPREPSLGRGIPLCVRLVPKQRIPQRRLPQWPRGARRPGNDLSSLIRLQRLG